MNRRTFVGVAALAAMLSASANAQYPVIMLDPLEALEEIKPELGLDVMIYFNGEMPPPGTMQREEVVIDISTRRATGDQEQSCRRVFLAAMKDMQQRARKVGANAVVNLVSFYGKTVNADPTKLECHRGREVRARITVRGNFAQIAR